MYIITRCSNYGDGTSSSVQALRSTEFWVADWVKTNYPDLDGAVERGETSLRVDDWSWLEITEMEVDVD